MAPGAAPANAAVSISPSRKVISVIGKVDEDEFGYMLADILKENNVNNDGMHFDPGARTSLAFVTLRKDGELEFIFYRNPSADMLLHECELDTDLIKKDEKQLRDALQFVNAYGALTVMERGTTPALLTKIAVRNAMLKTVAYAYMYASIHVILQVALNIDAVKSWKVKKRLH